MSNSRHRSRLPLVATLICCVTPAVAEPLFFVGGEGGSHQAYASVGLVAPWSDATGGVRWANRYWLDTQRYEYDANGNTIEARANSVSAAVVRSMEMRDGYFSLSAGLRWTDTRLSPDDPGNDRRGTKFSLPVQADGEYRLARARLSGIAAVEADNGSYWSRARLLFPLGAGNIAAGPELILKGSNTYSAWQAGVVVGGIPLGPGSGLTLKAGRSRQSGGRDGAYFGVEMMFAGGR